MTIQHYNQNGVLTVILPERIDTANSVEVGQQISEICCSVPHESIVLDASQMTYISSSGLRILLGLAKKEQGLKIKEVCKEVYNVFEMTGFNRIIPIEQRIREIVIDGKPVRGKGGIGVVYQLTEDTIIKVFREGTPIEEVQREMTLSKEALVFGLPTAIAFEVVRTGNQYGAIYELINAKTLASIINDNPTETAHYGAEIGRIMHQMHSVHDTQNKLPDAREATMEAIERLRRYFTDEEVTMMREIADAIPEGNSVLHCDLHPKNIMVSNGEPLLIDMGEVCHGNPLHDLGHTYSSMRGLVGDYQTIIGMDEAASHACFDAIVRTYFDTDDEALLAHRLEQVRVVSLLRNFTWMSLSSALPQEIIDTCREQFTLRIANNIDAIRKILPTLQEWK